MNCEQCEARPAEYQIKGHNFCLDCARTFLEATPRETERTAWLRDGATVYALTSEAGRKPVQVNRWSLQVSGGGAAGLRRDECEMLAEQIRQLPELLRENERLRAACTSALHFHNRYCDRVGAEDNWARTVHEKLRAAIETS